MTEGGVIKITAIISLTIIVCVALMKGIDSGLVASVSAVIGGIAGYEFGRKKSAK